MNDYAPLLDANVLYPAPMRDILLQLAVSDLFRAKWTAEIHREWIEALLRNEPHRKRAALERRRELMDRHTRDCVITGYEDIIPQLERRFATTLRYDIDAVQNAVIEPWSNGQTEGQINRLKMLKRSMYGRASIELLRARMLPLQDSDLHRE
jgi:transposase